MHMHVLLNVPAKIDVTGLRPLRLAIISEHIGRRKIVKHTVRVRVDTGNEPEPSISGLCQQTDTL